MARARGTAQLNVGVSEAILEEVRQFVTDRGETLREVVEMALRRHMDNPPPKPVVPPLPPVPVPVPKQRRK